MGTQGVQSGLVCMLLCAALTAHAETYIYQEKDGTRWITDRPMNSERFKFIDHYDHGRKTAEGAHGRGAPFVTRIESPNHYIAPYRAAASVRHQDSLMHNCDCGVWADCRRARLMWEAPTCIHSCAGGTGTR